MSTQELPENCSGAIDANMKIAYNSNWRVTIKKRHFIRLTNNNVKWSDYMAENENYKSYTANNGTELRFPKESVVQMTAEQRDCYQNFINVLAQILIKYAAAEKENQKI